MRAGSLDGGGGGGGGDGRADGGGTELRREAESGTESVGEDTTDATSESAGADDAGDEARQATNGALDLATDVLASLELLELGKDVLAFRRGPLTVVLNCGKKSVPLPEGEVVVASGPLTRGKLPADTAVWLA